MIHRTITSERGTVHYWIAKNANLTAQTIVFTHGMTGTHEMFEKQTTFFQKDYTVITWDFALHGASRPYFGFSYENNAKDLYAILASEGIEQVVLVGMSNGGYTSQEFAYWYPEKVLGLVALDTTPFGPKYYKKWELHVLNLFTPLVRLFPERFLRYMMAKSVTRTQYAFDLMQKMHAQYSKAEIIALTSLGYECLMAANKEVNFEFPVLILLGEHDKALNVDKFCRRWADDTGYALHFIENAGHF